MFTKYYTDNGDNIKFLFENDVQLLAFNKDYYRPVIPPAPRRIAGSKRVERYLREHGCDKGSGQGPLLQSITAHPALSTQSFEVCCV